MECNKIQEKLSFYIEGSLSVQDQDLVEEHLRSCEKCGLVLSDLQKTIEHVKQLEEVEPPAWFVQKVMKQVRAEAGEKSSLLRKLFYPLHIKLPVEAFAAALIAVAVMYIFKTIQPEIKIAQAPQEKILEKTLPAEKETIKPSAPPTKENETPAAFPRIQNKKQRMPFEKREDIVTREKDKMLPAAPLAELPVSQEKKNIPGKTEERVQDIVSAPKQIETEGLAKTGDSRRYMAAAPASKPAVEKGKALRKIEKVQINIIVADIQTARAEIEKLIGAIGGKIIGTDLYDKKQVIAELRADKFEELYKKLNDIGDIQGEKPAVSDAMSLLELNIILVTAQ